MESLAITFVPSNLSVIHPDKSGLQYQAEIYQGVKNFPYNIVHTLRVILIPIDREKNLFFSLGRFLLRRNDSLAGVRSFLFFPFRKWSVL